MCWIVDSSKIKEFDVVNIYNKHFVVHLARLIAGLGVATIYRML